VTFAYAVVDARIGEIRYANAGHNPPLVVRADGSVDRLSPTGLVLGITPDWVYSTGTVPFGRGDRLICYTDGITEAASPEDEEFGEDRLIATIAAAPEGPSEVVAAAINRAVAAWTRNQPQDDATLIVISLL
jgi:sigma-B regulation protein RsbU (phosphoserine phosphatase)